MRSLGSLQPAASLLALVCCAAPSLSSQTEASLGLGVGTARYPGGSTLNAAAISPTLQLDAAGRSITLAGTFASLPLGVWASQGRGDVWLATPAVFGGFQLAGEAIAAGTTRTDGGWTAAAHGVGELLWTARSWGLGVGAGPSAGWIANTPSVVALHTRARAWWQSGPVTYALTIEPTQFLGAWFTDATAGISTRTGPLRTALWATGRFSAVYGSKGAGGALVQLFPTSNVALEVGAGSYLPDPYQGLPRAGYVTAGVRVFAARRAASSAAVPAPPAWPALMPERRGDSVVVRFRMEGARSVGIAGDWDGWHPHTLESSVRDLWTGALVVPPGRYHFNLLVDGTEWVVPNGVAIVPDDAGGLVAVIMVR